MDVIQRKLMELTNQFNQVKQREASLIDQINVLQTELQNVRLVLIRMQGSYNTLTELQEKNPANNGKEVSDPLEEVIK